MITVRNYFLLFIIYSFFGWFMEVINNIVREKKFSNRGFYIGPICPIYGVGAVAIIILLSSYKEHPIGLFILGMVLCSTLEYYTSLLMEKLFKARWWDYKDRKFNINGRICLETTIPFGIIAVLLVYFINPFIMNYLLKVPNVLLNIIAILFFILFIIDLGISLNIVNSFKKTVKKASSQDKTDDINQYIKKILLEKSILYRRLINAFPKIQAKLKQ